VYVTLKNTRKSKVCRHKECAIKWNCSHERGKSMKKKPASQNNQNVISLVISSNNESVSG